jgi:hypothetical protein
MSKSDTFAMGQWDIPRHRVLGQQQCKADSLPHSTSISRGGSPVGHSTKSHKVPRSASVPQLQSARALVGHVERVQVPEGKAGLGEWAWWQCCVQKLSEFRCCLQMCYTVSIDQVFGWSADFFSCDSAHHPSVVECRFRLIKVWFRWIPIDWLVKHD